MGQKQYFGKHSHHYHFFVLCLHQFQNNADKSWKTWSSFGISGFPKFLNIKKSD